MQFMKIRIVHIAFLWIAISTIGGYLKITHQLDKISVILMAISLILCIVIVYKIVKKMTAS